MTRIDFHSNVPDKLAYACRLTRKAFLAKHRVVLLTEHSEDLQSLDQLLWTFSDQDFLPHAPVGSPVMEFTPILLADSDSACADLPSHEILINLSMRTPAHFARFERMFEIVSQDEADLNLGRERYRYYQQRGYPLTHFVAEKA